MRRTEQERLAELDEANDTFQRQTLRAIRVVAEKVPPEEARRALQAISALAKEALAEAKLEAHKHPASE
jgi:anion-transporting  ArsA/GET3 family ATPase